MANSVTFRAVSGLPLIEPGDDLAAIIIDALKVAGSAPASGDVLVVAQKVVSKAEGRYVRLTDIDPSDRARQLAAATGKDPRFVEVVLSESSDVVRHGPNVLIVVHRLGFVMANAGIDQSNIAHVGGEERVLLLPRDPDGAAAALKARLDAAFGAALGVVINDSFGRPWRNGVVGVALGAAGMPALLDLVGSADMFGRRMQVTEVAVADELAAGASLVMGQGAEGLPVVLVSGLEFNAASRPASALIRPRERDLFR